MLGLAFAEGAKNVRRNLRLTAVVVSAMGLVLLIAALVLTVTSVLDARLRDWESRVDIVAFLEPNVGDEQRVGLETELLAVPGVSSVEYVSPEAAWRDFIAVSEAPEDLVSADEVRLLTGSFTVHLEATVLQSADIETTILALRGTPGVADVRYGGDLLQRYATFRTALTRTTLIVMCGLALALCGLSTAVLRLGMSVRAAALRVWVLEGATGRFLTTMLVLEGVVHGVLASLGTSGAYVVITTLARHYLGLDAPIQSRVLGMILVLGPTLGALSAWLATRGAVRRAHAASVLAVILALFPHASDPPGNAAEVELVPREAKTTQEFDVGRWQRELERLQAQQTLAHDEITRLAGEGESLLSQLENIGNIEDEIHNNILNISAEVTNLDAQIGTFELEIEKTQGEYSSRAQEVVRISRLMELRPPRTTLSVFFDGSSQGATVRRAKIREILTSSRIEAFAALERSQRTLRAQKKALLTKKDQALELQQTLGENMKVHDSAREEKRALLARVQTEQAVAAATVADLEQSVREMERLLQRLQGGVQHYGPVPFPDLKGALPWPIEGGRVARRFGRRVAPVFLTVTVHDGWIVSPPLRESPVLAVHDGVVAYADWLRGYGKLIILDHGAGFQTLYGHCSALRVAQGDTVRAGDVLAAVGATGPVEDPALYFGVRVNGTAQDPRLWLAPN